MLLLLVTTGGISAALPIGQLLSKVGIVKGAADRFVPQPVRQICALIGLIVVVVVVVVVLLEQIEHTSRVLLVRRSSQVVTRRRIDCCCRAAGSTARHAALASCTLQISAPMFAAT